MSKIKSFKWLLLLIMIVSLLFATAITVGAEEVAEPGNEVAPETTVPDLTDAETPVEETLTEETLVTETDGEGNQTLIGRVYEFVTVNSEKLLGIVNLGTLAVIAYLSKNKNKILVTGLAKTVAGQKNVITAADSSEKAVAQMTAEQTAIGERLAAIEAGEIERDRMLKALLYETMTLVQMQHTLALNNGNIPQAIKNYATTLCANCLGAIENDEELKKAYEEMRNILGIKTKEGDTREKESA